MKQVKIFFISILIIALILSVWLTPEAATLQDFKIERIFHLLGILFVIALFLERSLDVFLTTWRASHSEKLHSKIEEHEKQIIKLESNNQTKNSKAIDKLKINLNSLKLKKLEYRSKTRNIAMWSGLLCGILISAAGLRTLQSFVEFDNDINWFQQGLFHFLDVLLTGGLIAGGSDSIHKLTELYRSFVEKTTEKTAG